jgi:ligand-binding sensor domain-containing protein
LKHLAVPVLEDPSAPAPAAAPLGEERGFRAEEMAALPAHVTALHRGPEGALWAGTFDAGLYRASPGGAFEEVAGLEGPARFVNAIAAHEGTVWVATARGLFRFTPRGRPQGRVMGGAVEALAELHDAPAGLGPDGTLVAGTTRGLYAIGPNGPVRPVGGRDGAALRVSALAQGAGALWAGTPDGLYAIANGSARFVPLVFGDDAAGSNWVTALAPCGDGVLAATDDGGHARVALARGASRTTSVRAVRFADPPANSTNPGAAVQLGDDVFLGTPGGILRVSARADGGVETALLTALRGTHVSALAAEGDALLAGTGDGRVFRVVRARLAVGSIDPG